MRRWWLIVVIVGWFGGLEAASLKDMPSQSVSPLVEITACQGPGMNYEAVGWSGLEGGTLRVSSPVTVSLVSQARVVSVWALWMGEVAGADGVVNHILFKNQQGDVHDIKAIWTERDRATGTVYACGSDVTTWWKGNGVYMVSGLGADVMPGGTRTASGWGLWVAYERPGEPTATVNLKRGLRVLHPSESYELTLLAPSPRKKVMKLTVMGARGGAELGGANLINGRSLTGRSDWTGASGERWDVWTGVSDQGIGAGQGVVLTIDPLLGWLYPVWYSVNIKEGK